MAKRSTPSDKILIDPLFGIPEGAEDQFTLTKDEVDTEDFVDIDELVNDVITPDYQDGSEIFVYEDNSDDLGGVVLEIPDDYSVISQTLRRAPGGQQVVDIVIETEDIDGALNYEIQVTKL